MDMSDLHDRFRSLDRRPAPFLWTEIERRAEGSVTTVPVGSVRRVGSIPHSSTPGIHGRPLSSLGLMAAALLVLAALVSAAVLVGASLLTRPTSVAPGPGEFTPTGSLAHARWGQTATLLRDGRVLILGGSNGDGPFFVDSAQEVEIFDPVVGTFTTVGTLAGMSSMGLSATVLPDGQVLVVGGSGSPTPPYGHAALFDPASGAFLPTGTPVSTIADHSATLLPDGRVLSVCCVGDVEPTAATSAELWDPADGTFQAAGTLPEPRISFAAWLLPDSRVMVAGGAQDVPVGQDPAASGGTPTPMMSNGAVATTEIWDLVSYTFSPGPTLPEPRANATATILADGRVLVAGGTGTDGILASAEVWDPVTKTFTPTGSMQEARVHHTATLLPDGRVLIAGGQGTSGRLASAELWDPSTGTFTPAGPLIGARESHTATLLADGRVLIAGGELRADDSLTSAELYDETR